jgi:DNA segregation ATPase FtsK/SpoIIIE-like protein
MYRGAPIKIRKRMRVLSLAMDCDIPNKKKNRIKEHKTLCSMCFQPNGLLLGNTFKSAFKFVQKSRQQQEVHFKTTKPKKAFAEIQFRRIWLFSYRIYDKTENTWRLVFVK